MLYVTADADDGTDDADADVPLAWAVHCEVDQFGRPTAGQVHFHSQYFGLSIETLRSTALHEIVHALAFSSDLLPTFRNGLGDAWAPTTATADARGEEVTVVTTPAVRDAARSHLGCDTLAGAELEDSGGISSAGSHWESRVFGPELMAASIGAAQNSPALSSLTLALFEDSGWYRPDYAAAEPLAWGRGAGCAFVESACIDKASGAVLPEGSSLFCTTAAEAGCTSDRKRRGACARLQYASAITPASQRYFDDAAAGGPAFFDYCPVFAGSSGGAASCADA